jgi:hypothetical protein
MILRLLLGVYGIEGTHFLQYASVIGAIPREWKRSIQQNGHLLEDFSPHASLAIMRKISKPSEYFYQIAKDLFLYHSY